MNKVVQIVIIVVCLAGAGYLIFNHLTSDSGSSADAPKTYIFQCADTNCANAWTWVAGAPTPGDLPEDTCPKCKTEWGMESAKCPSCGGMHSLVGHGGYQKNCPHCGDPMPPMAEQVEAMAGE